MCRVNRWISHPSSSTSHESHYYNRKGWYSVIVQAVVDANFLFTDLNIGWPGSVQNARVLSNSQLYQKCVDRDYLEGDSLQVNNHAIPLFYPN